jgi:DNA-3-methyladenine glycosylase I
LASSDQKRCDWAGTDPLYIRYHDEEWGVPCHDEHRLFEMLILEGAQAGLSWITILKKRERYREVYRGFDPELVARFDGRKKRQLLNDPGIVRNRLKIDASILNARLFLELQDDCGSFDEYIWGYVDGLPQRNRPRSMKDVPASTVLSDRISKDLRKRGFKFVGSTIMYAFMQSVGVVDDHLRSCIKGS